MLKDQTGEYSTGECGEYSGGRYTCPNVRAYRKGYCRFSAPNGRDLSAVNGQTRGLRVAERPGAEVGECLVWSSESVDRKPPAWPAIDALDAALNLRVTGGPSEADASA